VLFTSLSIPMFVTLLNGQDLAFVLLFLAASISLHRRGRRFAAGVVFAFCAVKFHLLVLVPLLLAARRNWRWGAGAATGSIALLGLSFAVQGWGWPAAYYHVLTDPAIHPGLTQMPSLHGLLGRWRAPAALEGALIASLAVVIVFIVRRRSFEYALAAALAGGLLASYHSYLADCTLLLPAGLIVLAETSWPALRLVAVILLTPLTSLLLLLNSPVAGAPMPLAVLALVALMGLEARASDPLKA
jgi:hypothetical protein